MKKIKILYSALVLAFAGITSSHAQSTVKYLGNYKFLILRVQDAFQNIFNNW